VFVSLLLLSYPSDCGFSWSYLREGPEFESISGLWPMLTWLWPMLAMRFGRPQSKMPYTKYHINTIFKWLHKDYFFRRTTVGGSARNLYKTFNQCSLPCLRWSDFVTAWNEGYTASFNTLFL